MHGPAESSRPPPSPPMAPGLGFEAGAGLRQHHLVGGTGRDGPRRAWNASSCSSADRAIDAAAPCTPDDRAVRSQVAQHGFSCAGATSLRVQATRRGHEPADDPAFAPVRGWRKERARDRWRRSRDSTRAAAFREQLERGARVREWALRTGSRDRLPGSAHAAIGVLRHHERPERTPAAPREDVLAPLERASLVGGWRSSARRREFQLVKKRGIPPAQTGVGTHARVMWRQGPRRDAVEPAAHLLFSARRALRCARAAAALPARAGAGTRRGRLFAHVTVGIGTEIAQALEQVLFPRAGSRGRRAGRCPLECAAEANPHRARHEHVADDQVGAEAVAELECTVAVVGLAYLGPRRRSTPPMNQVTVGIVIGHHDARPSSRGSASPCEEARNRFRLGRGVGRHFSLTPPGGEGECSLGTRGEKPHPAADS